MAVDKLIDSTKLDNALTYEAGKIRAKLESQSALTFDFANEKGFGDYIEQISSGGGGDLGGLANMVDVSTQNYDFAYMLMCLKNGDSTGGEFRFTTAFPNTSTKIVETGLTEVHGIIFVATDRASTGTGTGVNGMIVIFVLEDNTLFALGIEGTNQGRYSGAQGTQQSATPLQGAVTITDGDVYYKARYNQNAQYQLLRNNTPYEWLAWGVK